MTNVYSDKSTTYSQVGAAKRILSDDLQSLVITARTRNAAVRSIEQNKKGRSL